MTADGSGSTIAAMHLPAFPIGRASVLCASLLCASLFVVGCDSPATSEVDAATPAVDADARDGALDGGAASDAGTAGDAASHDAASPGDAAVADDASSAPDTGQPDGSVAVDAYVGADAYVAPDAYVAADAYVAVDAYVAPDAWVAQYHVTYDANGATGGVPPTDATAYGSGASVTVRGNTGALVRAGYTFGGWNTQADGLGTSYVAGATFSIASDVVLFAVWMPLTQTIVFDGAGGSGTMSSITAPTGSTVTLPPNAFSRSHWSFAGWGTSASGWVVYTNGQSFSMPPMSLTLYAKWTIPTVSVPAGTFQRDATVTNTSTVSAFRMARYELTVDQLLEIGLTDTSGASDPQLPFDAASWYLALVVCNRLSMREGLTPVYTISGSTNPASWGALPTTTSATWDAVVADWSADGYRMPTEMEWLWAAMGAHDGATGYTKLFPGTTGTVSDYAWLAANSGGHRHVVGTLSANELGIYDLAGNASEQIWDRENDYNYVTGAVTDYRGLASTSVRTRVYRGGDYTMGPAWARLDWQGRSYQPETYAYSGIRLVRR